MVKTSANTENSKAFSKAIASSYRILSIREHSEKQLRLKLQKKAHEQIVIDACIDFLKDENWLSEDRFCNVFIRSRAKKGQGLTRIQFELKQQNISNQVIQQQLKEEGIDWQLVCEKVLQKKISFSNTGFFTDSNTDTSKSHWEKPKTRKRLENFLQYRGFSMDEIKTAFSRLQRSL